MHTNVKVMFGKIFTKETRRVFKRHEVEKDLAASVTCYCQHEEDA